MINTNHELFYSSRCGTSTRIRSKYQGRKPKISNQLLTTLIWLSVRKWNGISLPQTLLMESDMMYALCVFFLDFSLIGFAPDRPYILFQEFNN